MNIEIPLPNKWKIAYCNEKPYYYNSHTKKSQWEKPVEWKVLFDCLL